ncbi:HEAT repeat domain-containing protein [Thermococcus sibiricus]|uniref:HEAT repeat domain-containing protein n=1 Tax=Thermococcus sibiricus (strain DSM 12597 / MM 739) TaxID=604354 RepID=C5ZZZ7_THESM|nr:hypothetical protein [Thermococcus sibiricus]ACS90978.1 hypothetical protein TSIB_1929 [Thermococcus sibiricus MM 739]
MGLFSFGSKKNKVIKMISQGDLEEILISAMKDKKYVDAIIELLDEHKPGLRGDALLLLGELVSRHKDLMMEYIEDGLPVRVLLLVEDPDPYVKENAMQTFELMLRFFPWAEEMFRNEIVPLLMDILKNGDRNRKAFAMLMLKKLKVKEALPLIAELVNVEEAVILPFEGIKWVPLGEIAKEVIKELGGEMSD